MDPFDLKPANLEIDAIYCKFSYLMDYYKWYENDDVNDNLKKLVEVLEKIGKDFNKKIF